MKRKQTAILNNMDEMKTQLSNHRKNILGERKEIKAENKEDVDTMESELEFFKNTSYRVFQYKGYLLYRYSIFPKMLFEAYFDRKVLFSA